MPLPQKSLTFPTMPLPSQLPASSEVGTVTPFCLGQPSQQELQQGKVILVFSHCLGTVQGDSAFKKFCPELVGVTWSFSSSVICFVPIQSPPLHTDTSAHFSICTFYVAKRVFPLKNTSLESDWYNSSDTFKLTFVPLLWLRKRKDTFPFLTAKGISARPESTSTAEKESSGQDLQHHPIQ